MTREYTRVDFDRDFKDLIMGWRIEEIAAIVGKERE